MVLITVAAAVALATSAPAPAAPFDSLLPREWKVPWEGTRPRDPYPDAQGRVWFVGQTGDYIAFLDPRTGQFKRFELEKGTGPHNQIVDEEGNVWYAGNRRAHIGKLDPNTGQITKYNMPDSTPRDPHTLIFSGTGEIWFTAQQSSYVGRLHMKTGKIDLVQTGPRTRPYGIVMDAKGRPWFDLFGTNKIGTIDPATMKLKEYPLPDERARPRRIAVTSDGIVWYGDYSRGYLGRLDPATGKVEEWAMPGAQNSLPYAMTVDDRDRLWLAETGVRPNRLVAFDPRQKEFTMVAEVQSGVAGGPAGANTIRHMVFHKPTREIWFGSDANTVGRLKVP